MTDVDLMWVHQSTVCRIVQCISRCIACQKLYFMTFPSNLSTSKQDFYDIAGFPSVLGAMDCTHILLVSSGGDGAKIYHNIKTFSI